MISHTHRTIFVHVPKTAGTSIESALGHYGPQGVLRGMQDHRSLRQLQWPGGGWRQLSSAGNRLEVARAVKGRLQRPEHAANSTRVTRAQYAGYFKFAVVRNPWARAYSWYRNVLNDPLHRRRLRVPADISLGSFLLAHDGSDLLQPQTHWLVDFTGRIGVDLVCRFETIERDYGEVCERLGIAATPLPLLNPGDDAAYVDAYDDRARRIVADRHRREIDYFGYTFGT